MSLSYYRVLYCFLVIFSPTIVSFAVIPRTALALPYGSTTGIGDDVICAVSLKGQTKIGNLYEAGRISAIIDMSQQKTVLIAGTRGLFVLKDAEPDALELALADNRLDLVPGGEPTKTGQISTIVDVPRSDTVLIGCTKGLFVLKDNRLDGPVPGGETMHWIFSIVDVPRLDTVLVGGENGLFKFEQDSLIPVRGGEPTKRGDEQTKTGRISTIVDVPRLDTVLVGGENGLFKFEQDSLIPVRGSKEATHGWISSIHKLDRGGLAGRQTPDGEETVLAQGARGLFVFRDDRLAPVPGAQTGWISTIVKAPIGVPRSDTVLVGGEKGLFILQDRLLHGPVPGGEQTKTGRISTIVPTSLTNVNVLVVGYKGLFTFFRETQPIEVAFKRFPAAWEGRPLDVKIEVKVTSRCAEAISSAPELIVTKMPEKSTNLSGHSENRPQPKADSYPQDVNELKLYPPHSATMLFPVRLTQAGNYKLQVSYSGILLHQEEYIPAYPTSTWWAAIAELAFALSTERPFISTVILVISTVILAYLMLTALCIVLFIFWPLTLLKIGNASVLHKDVKIPWLGIDFPLSHLLIIDFFQYRLRVLDAWVKVHISVARERFEQVPTVQERAIHITLPVTLNSRNRSDLTANDLRSIFTSYTTRVLICGEGGAGKTHIACRIAKWVMEEEMSARPCAQRMLPVLLEEGLGRGENKTAQRLIDEIGRKLQILVDEWSQIPHELLEHLLRQRRVLVIVDHLSEMTEETQTVIQHAGWDFPVNALVVTSRVEEHLGGVQRTDIRPLRITADGLVSFMMQYIRKNTNGREFTEKEIWDGCSRLLMAVGNRHITPLLAKLYAGQMIEIKKGNLKAELPGNIPDLMLSYLNTLNNSIPKDNRFENLTIQRDAKVVAWECVRATYRPAPAKSDDIIQALIILYEGNLSVEDAKTHSTYLSERLRVIQSVSPSENFIQFTLDPLAEYLAGLHAVDLYGNEEGLWHNFLARTADIPGAPKAISEFLLALQECCLRHRTAVPTFVISELEKLAFTEAMEN